MKASFSYQGVDVYYHVGKKRYIAFLRTHSPYARPAVSLRHTATLRDTEPLAGPYSVSYTSAVVWEFIFMMLILKIPIVYLCLVVYWAIKAEPEPPEHALLAAELPEPRRPVALAGRAGRPAAPAARTAPPTRRYARPGRRVLHA